MDDLEIIELYFQRNENAIRETSIKYGSFCKHIAYNILSCLEDAEECVNDTYLKTWNKIPPEEPIYFKGWLCRIVRNISLDLWRKNHRQKRYAGIEELFDELDQCIPSSKKIDDEIEAKELTTILNKWLAELTKVDRTLFIRRYWYGESVKNLAKEYRATPQDIANRMYRLRKKLKSKLEKEEISI